MNCDRRKIDISPNKITQLLLLIDGIDSEPLQ